MKNSLFSQIVGTYQYKIWIENKRLNTRKVTWKNLNKLLKKDAVGIKTG